MGDFVSRPGGTSLPDRNGPRLRGLVCFFFTDKTRALAAAAILFFCAAATALGHSYKARTVISSVEAVQLPLLEAAIALEGRVYEAVFYVGIFGATGDMASYSGSRIRFAAIRKSAGRVAELAAAVPRGREVGRDTELLGEYARRLDVMVEKQRSLIDALAAEREKLRGAAKDLGGILLDLQAGTVSSPPERKAGPGAEPDAKARLLALTGFALALEAVTHQATAGLSKSATELAAAEDVFAERWPEARDACRAAEPGVFSRMEDLAGSYRETLGLLRFNMEEVERLATSREEILGRLATLTRGIVILVRDIVGETVAGAERALFRGLFSGGIFFAAAMAVCLGIFFRFRGSGNAR